jgi:hypothetical protein
MKLSEFVSNTLVQIVEGVQSAQEATGSIGGVVNPSPVEKMPPGDKIDGFAYDEVKGTYLKIQQVRFDVAVTATEEAGAGAIVGVLGIGGKLQSSDTAQSAGRIQFEVDIALPRPAKSEK